MNRINQVILAVDFVHVDVVIVTPPGGPRVAVYKPIAAVVEAAIVASRNPEMVLAAEVGTEIFLADAAPIVVPAVPLGLLRIVVLVTGSRIMLGLLHVVLVASALFLLSVILLGAIFLVLLLLLGRLLLLFFVLLLLFGGLLLLLLVLLLLLFFSLGAIGLLVVLLGIARWLFLLGPVLGLFFLGRLLVGRLLFPRFLLLRGLIFVLVRFLKCKCGGSDDQREQCGSDCEFHSFLLKILLHQQRGADVHPRSRVGVGWKRSRDSFTHGEARSMLQAGGDQMLVTHARYAAWGAKAGPPGLAGTRFLVHKPCHLLALSFHLRSERAQSRVGVTSPRLPCCSYL